MDEDRLAALAAMYQADDATPTQTPLDTPSRVRKIRVGVIEYQVPSVEYVQHLERIVDQQARMLRQHQELLDRLAGSLSKARFAQQGQGREIDLLRREVTPKGHRDFT